MQRAGSIAHHASPDEQCRLLRPLDAIESGAQEVLADDWAKLVKSGLTLDPKARSEQIFAALGA